MSYIQHWDQAAGEACEAESPNALLSLQIPACTGRCAAGPKAATATASVSHPAKLPQGEPHQNLHGE